MMANRRRGRRRSLVPIKFQTQITLGSLANDVAVSVATVDSLEQDFDIVSTHCTFAMRAHTAGEGPIDVGLAEQGYSVAEIVEAVDASPLSQYGTANERSNRRVRLMGTFAGNDANEVLNDGEKIKQRLFLRAFAHSTFAVARVWAINRRGSPLTTGSVIEVTGVHWGRWK